MLVEIKIENFALVRDLEVNFQKGLNVITGESGAGKSLLVESLNFVLGARIKSTRFSNDETVRVQAVFELPGRQPQVINELVEKGLAEPGEMLVLMRKYHPSGRNIYHLNGNIIPFKLFRQVGESLVDIHGQKDSQFLLEESNQLTTLDQACGAEGISLTEQVKELSEKHQETHRELSRLRDQERERLRRIDWLQFEIQEIKKAATTPDEDRELERQRSILTNAERISQLSAGVYDTLLGDGGAVELVNQASGLLSRWDRLDQQVEEITSQLESALSGIQQVAVQCRELGEECAFDQERLDAVMERLHTLENLKRKYGPTLQEVEEYLERSQEQLNKLQRSGKTMKELEEKLHVITAIWQEKADALSALRKVTAARLQEQVTKELAQLGMEDARFVIDIRREGDPPVTPEIGMSRVSPSGYDKVKFTLSPVPGHAAKPLSLIASGGELSRVMLALKNVFANFRDFSTLVLDEIDVGIGGVTAQSVGTKLQEISRHRQVICVTHQPVIAAMAQVHFQIEKTTVNGDTVTALSSLAGSTRVDEVARMISGEEAMGESRKVAKKLLKGKA